MSGKQRKRGAYRGLPVRILPGRSSEMRRGEKAGKGQSDLPASTFFSDSISFSIHQAQVLNFGIVYPEPHHKLLLRPSSTHRPRTLPLWSKGTQLSSTGLDHPPVAPSGVSRVEGDSGAGEGARRKTQQVQRP